MSDSHCSVQAENQPRLRNSQAKVLLLGNPNVGKTSLFNALSGSKAKVGNYPGVTVERRSSTLKLSHGDAELIDVPGTYSLSARSPDELVAVRAALGLDGYESPDLILSIADSAQLERSLYLSVQLLEFGIPLIVVLNMADEANSEEQAIKLHQAWKVPVICTSATSGLGIAELKAAVEDSLKTLLPTAEEASPSISQKFRALNLDYPEELRAPIDHCCDRLPEAWIENGRSRSSGARNVSFERALVRWLLLSIDSEDELDIPADLRQACLKLQQDRNLSGDLDLDLVQCRYDFLSATLSNAAAIHEKAHPAAPAQKKRPSRHQTRDRFDAVLLHPLLGPLLFLATMLLVFQALFSWSDPLIGAIEALLESAQNLNQEHLPSGILSEFVSGAMLGGVGNVLVFLPQVAMLFFFLAILEDSGYLARIAFLTDRLMRFMGLNGKAFVPILGGFACAVPAIAATKTMDRPRDRLLTMLVLPLTTCSARLPVYTLIAAAMFPLHLVFFGISLSSWILTGMYFFGILMTLVVAIILSKSLIPAKRIPLVLELPPYRLPRLSSVGRQVLSRSKSFLKEAGSVIFLWSIVMWVGLSFPRSGATDDQAAFLGSAPPIAESYAGQLGKGLEPVFEPLGFDWKISIGLVGAFAAREVFVSTLGMVFGLEDLDDEAAPLRDKLRNSQIEQGPDSGKPSYGPATAIALLIFFAIACQCMSTLAMLKRETQGWKWPSFVFGYTFALAFGLAWLGRQAVLFLS